MASTTSRAPRRADDLPHPLTFFLTAAQRAAVLRALRRRGGDRSAALLRALRVEPSTKRGDA